MKNSSTRHISIKLKVVLNKGDNFFKMESKKLLVLSIVSPSFRKSALYIVENISQMIPEACLVHILHLFHIHKYFQAMLLIISVQSIESEKAEIEVEIEPISDSTTPSATTTTTTTTTTKATKDYNRRRG